MLPEPTLGPQTLNNKRRKRHSAESAHLHTPYKVQQIQPLSPSKPSQQSQQKEGVCTILLNMHMHSNIHIPVAHCYTLPVET